MSTHEDFSWSGRRHGGAKRGAPWSALSGRHEGGARGEHGGIGGSEHSFGGEHGFGGGPGFGGWGGWGGRGRGRGGRARRGDVRAAVLLLLSEQPRNGYQIIGELAERSRGAWKPSPGSVYPVLQQLEDEGLVVSGAADVGRVYRITETGSAYVEAHREEMGVPWEDAARAMTQPVYELAQQIPQVMGAIKQVMSAGSERQMTQASAVLAETRRSLYRILAEDSSTPPGDEGTDAAPAGSPPEEEG
jgi:DNA-binding PadR family transcriptional regulator